MNAIREIQSLNKRELENNVSIQGSWHRDFDDTAYIYIGGLPFDLSEGDVITIFSQYGEPVYVNLVRDKETGKSKGFAFLKYEDQRSTDLAVDNLGGATILGRTLKVDHTRYKRKDDEEEEARTAAAANPGTNEEGIDGKRARAPESDEERPMLKEERELAVLIRNHDEDDPMKEYLVQEKREEAAQAVAALKKKARMDDDRKKKHHHKHHRHRSRRHSNSESDEERRRRHKSQRQRSRSP